MSNTLALVLGLVGLLALVANVEDSGKPNKQPSKVVATSTNYPSFQLNPIVDLAPQFRQKNKGGSCVHVTTVMLLRWQGLYAEADAWLAANRGGENYVRHEQKLKQAGLRYAMTSDGDIQLLEWAIATRRGAGVTWSPMHVVALVGRIKGQDGQQYAVILDNNAIDKFKYQEWNSFVREWQSRGGWAFVVVGKTPPPVPM